MNRDTKKLEYIKKVWGEQDGSGKDERYVNVSLETVLLGILLIRWIPECVSMTASSTKKEDIGPVQ